MGAAVHEVPVEDHGAALARQPEGVEEEQQVPQLPVDVASAWGLRGFDPDPAIQAAPARPPPPKKKKKKKKQTKREASPPKKKKGAILWGCFGCDLEIEQKTGRHFGCHFKWTSAAESTPCLRIDRNAKLT